MSIFMCTSVKRKRKQKLKTSTHAGVTGLDTKFIYIYNKGKKLR